MIDTWALVGSYQPLTRAGETTSVAPKGQILPGTSQAKGPRGQATLKCLVGMTEGEVCFVDLS